MTIILPTVAVSELQRSTKRVLDELRPFALVQSHGRTKGLLLSAELGERLLADGTLTRLLEIPTDDEKQERPREETARTTSGSSTHLATLADLTGNILSALGDR